MTTEDKTRLTDWYASREICTPDEEKFLRFWRRQLSRSYGRYLQEVELELLEIPELVNYRRAVHSVVNGETTGNNSQTVNTENSGTNSQTTNGGYTLDRTSNSTTDTTNSNTSDGTNSGTDTVTRDETTNTTAQREQLTENIAEHLERGLPQSTVYGAGGFPDQLDWQYASGQSADRTKNGTVKDTNETSTDGTNTTTRSGTDHREDTGTTNTETDATGKDTQTHNDTVTGTTSGTSETTVSGENSGTNRNESDTVESGQNELETEIRAKIRGYIMNSISLDWLLSQLEICFMGVFE